MSQDKHTTWTVPYMIVARNGRRIPDEVQIWAPTADAAADKVLEMNHGQAEVFRPTPATMMEEPGPVTASLIAAGKPFMVMPNTFGWLS